MFNDCASLVRLMTETTLCLIKLELVQNKISTDLVQIIIIKFKGTEGKHYNENLGNLLRSKEQTRDKKKFR